MLARYHWYIVCFYMYTLKIFMRIPGDVGWHSTRCLKQLPQKVSVWKNRARSPWFIVMLSTQMSIHSCRALSTSKTQPCRWSEAGHECRLPSPCDRLIGFDHLTVCVGRWRPVSAPADVTWEKEAKQMGSDGDGVSVLDEIKTWWNKMRP